MNENLIPNATLYASRYGFELGEKLGSGKDGIVLVGKRKMQPGRIALKAMRWSEAYEQEKRAYARLQQTGTATVLGFNVPQLTGNDDGLRVLEMTVVERPFVLDFAGAHVDNRPEFPDEVWADWEAERREQFEARWPMVERILAAFEELGIYLLDVSPGNIGFLDQEG